MADSKEKYITHLENALQDQAQQLQPDDKVRALDQAVVLYSKDKPYLKIQEDTGDGSAYDFDLPSDWVDGFSFIDGEIEYPADDYQKPLYVDDNEWIYFAKLVSTVRTVYLRFLSFTPATGKTIRYTYVVPHTLNSSTNTIFEIDFKAVVHLAAAICFWALAARYAQSADSSIDADVVDYQRQSDMYVELAKSNMEYYNRILGKGQFAKDNSAATAGISTRDLDMAYQYGSDYLTHPHYTR